MSVPRLRAPAEHGQILAVPPLDQVGELLARNANPDKSKLEPLFFELRNSARRIALATALQYLRDAGETCSPRFTAGDHRWFVAGHQPELFHPGVWFKNVVLHHLARTHDGVALNLIIDSDTAKSPVLHIPNGDKIARLPYDRSSTDAPYEECTVQDERLFADLPQRLAPFAKTWGFEPLLADFWRDVMKQTSRSNLIGERFAAARRALERRFGITPLEVPMSRLCQTTPFASFIHLICRELERFHATYNDAVHSYRRDHDIRSRNHPVPDLTKDDDWLETPFWAWRRGQTRRHKLFLRKTSADWSLRFGSEVISGWPNGIGASEMLKQFEQGLKIRPRALTTTMFARLFLADVFIHGIGGGIYDALTDRIIERFWGVPAPGYLIVSATLLLPLPRFLQATTQAKVLARRLRDLQYQPDRFVAPSGDVAILTQSKMDWIARDGATHAERLRRFEQIRAINAQLHPFVASEMNQTRAALAQRLHEVECDNVAARRDFAFCLYPEAMLREIFTRPVASLRY